MTRRTDAFRVALWQCRPAPAGDVPAALERLDAVLAEAAAAEADVLVTPEMFLGGYAVPVPAVHAAADPPDGPAADAVAALSARHGIAVAYGCAERSPAGRVHNAARLAAGGRTVLTHHKMQLFGDLDRERFAAGDALPSAVELGGRRVALLICFDVEFPEAVRAAAEAGADLVLVPTANMVGYEAVSRVLVPARAYENGVAVAYANYVGQETPAPGETVRYGGLSAVGLPDATVSLASADADQLLLVDLPAPGPTPGAPDHPSQVRRDLYGRP